MKYLIPTILTATILIAASFVFMPIERATTTHGSAGSVSGSVTSTSIADGTITTADLADNAVTNPKVANSAITDAKVDLTTPTIKGGITVDRTLQTGVANSRIPLSNLLNSPDTANVVGQFTSITIGTDGFPVISYRDDTNGNLRVVKCGNAACSAGNTLTAVDTTNDVGVDTSITIGTDGFPVISYHDATNLNGDLRVAKCGNAACSAGNTLTAVDTTNAVGTYTSITIGTDGFPVVSYRDITNSDLRVVKCGSILCISNWIRR